MRNDKMRAYKLRIQGRSYNEISKLLKIPKSTLSTWFASLLLPEDAQARIKKRVATTSLRALLKRNIAQTHYAEQRAHTTREEFRTKVGALSERDICMMGIALYWAEGYKRPTFRNGKARTSHPVRITNSDPKLIALFMRFIREVCKVPEEKITASLRIFEHQNESYLLDFWQKIVKIPHSRFGKSYTGISLSSKGKRPFNILPYGVIQVAINSTPLYHQIMGYIQGVQE